MGKNKSGSAQGSKPASGSTDAQNAGKAWQLADSNPMSVMMDTKAADGVQQGNWPSEPAVYKHTADRAAIFSQLLCSFKDVQNMIEQHDQQEHCHDHEHCGGDDHHHHHHHHEIPQPLQYNHDVVVLEDPEEAEEEADDQEADAQEVTADSIKKFVTSKEARGMLVVQPQRFHDGLWRLVASLEAQLSCLVTCIAHVTGGDSTALPDSLETARGNTWLCQTKGTSSWSLSATGNEQEAKDFTLQAGDVLYVPKGSQLELMSTSGDVSAYVRCAVDPRCSWGNLAQNVVQAVMAAPSGFGPETLRKALPGGFLSNCNLAAGDSKNKTGKEAASTLASALRDVADLLDFRPDDVLLPATDIMAAEFMKNRLPPHPAHLADPGPEPTIDDSLAVRGQGLFMLVPVADQDEEPCVTVATPLFNKRTSHMMGESEKSDENNEDLDLEDLFGPMPESEDDGDEEDDEKDDEADGGKVIEKAQEAKKAKGKAEEEKPAKGGKAAAETQQKQEEGEDDDDDEGEDDDDNEDDDDDEEEDEEEVLVPGPVVPASYAMVISKVLNTSAASGGIKIKDLIQLCPNKHEDEAMNLVDMLWHEGFAITLPAGKQQAAVKEEQKGSSKAGKRAADADDAGAQGSDKQQAKKKQKVAESAAQAAKKSGKGGKK